VTITLYQIKEMRIRWPRRPACQCDSHECRAGPGCHDSQSSRGPAKRCGIGLDYWSGSHSGWKPYLPRVEF